MSLLKNTSGYRAAKSAAESPNIQDKRSRRAPHKEEYNDQTLQQASEMLSEGTALTARAAMHIDPRVALYVFPETLSEEMEVVKFLSEAAYGNNNLDKSEKYSAAVRAEDLSLGILEKLSKVDPKGYSGWEMIRATGNQELLLRLLDADNTGYLHKVIAKYHDMALPPSKQEDTWMPLAEKLGWVEIDETNNEANVLLGHMWKLGFPSSQVATVLQLLAHLGNYQVRFRTNEQTYSEFITEVATCLPGRIFSCETGYLLEEVLNEQREGTFDNISRLALMEYGFGMLRAMDMDNAEVPGAVNRFMQANENLAVYHAALKALGFTKEGRPAYLLTKEPIKAIKALQSMSGELHMISGSPNEKTGGMLTSDSRAESSSFAGVTHIPLLAEFSSFEEYLSAEQAVAALNVSGELESIEFILMDTTLDPAERCRMPRGINARLDVEQSLHMLDTSKSSKAKNLMLTVVGAQMKLAIADNFASWKKLADAAWKCRDLGKILRSIQVNSNSMNMVAVENCMRGTRWLITKTNSKRVPNVNPTVLPDLAHILLERAWETKITPGSLLDIAVRAPFDSGNREKLVMLCNANSENLLLPENALDVLLDSADMLTVELREEMIRIASQKPDKAFTEEVLEVLKRVVDGNFHSRTRGINAILEVLEKLDAEFPWNSEKDLAAALLAKLLKKKYRNDYKAWVLADELLESWEAGSFKDFLESVDAVL